LMSNGFSTGNMYQLISLVLVQILEILFQPMTCDPPD
jgi:hypothetical protein